MEARVYNSSVQTAMLYGCKTSSLHASDFKMLSNFNHPCLQHIPHKLREQNVSNINPSFECDRTHTTEVIATAHSFGDYSTSRAETHHGSEGERYFQKLEMGRRAAEVINRSTANVLIKRWPIICVEWVLPNHPVVACVMTGKSGCIRWLIWQKAKPME